MKIIERNYYLLYRTRMYFSESPRHFDIIVVDDTLKNVTFFRVSAYKPRDNNVFPVPINTIFFY